MKVGVIGSGTVGQTLATGFLAHGHQVTIGSRTPSKLEEWSIQNPSGSVGDFKEAAAYGEVVVLAVEGLVAESALNLAGADSFAGKTVIDVTNPIGDGPPVDGVLPFFTDFKESLMEKLQKQFPEGKFVKAFNSVGAYSMVNPTYKEGKPTMFICGTDAGAKAEVTTILNQFGWEAADMGVIAAARAIEPLCMLWCIPGFINNEWTHAFKLVHR